MHPTSDAVVLPTYTPGLTRPGTVQSTLGVALFRFSAAFPIRCMVPQSQLELLGLASQELTDMVQRMGEPRFRARQLFEALYRQRLTTLEGVSTLPKTLRSRLASEGYRIGFPVIEQRFLSIDGTVRYLLRFSDGQTVETVWMPDGDGVEDTEDVPPGAALPHPPAPLRTPASSASNSRPSRRGTICLSSQAGCAVNCKFCMTALLGLQRNLTTGEIIGQVLLVLNDHSIEIGRDRVNLVFMGQGEPFLNYENFMGAVRLLVEGTGIPESRMTVSTSGIVPRIADFGAEPVRPHLAISLNGSNDEVRERVMPINRKWISSRFWRQPASFPCARANALPLSMCCSPESMTLLRMPVRSYPFLPEFAPRSISLRSIPALKFLSRPPRPPPLKPFSKYW